MDAVRIQFRVGFPTIRDHNKVYKVYVYAVPSDYEVPHTERGLVTTGFVSIGSRMSAPYTC